MTDVTLWAPLSDNQMRTVLPDILKTKFGSDINVSVRENKDERSCLICSDNGGYALVDCSSKSAAESIGRAKIPSITCGLSSKDTLTFSSIKDDRALLSLQRTLTRFDGSIAEPQEIPINLSRLSEPYPVICAAGVFILSGTDDTISDLTL
jgi:hypothetical protein